MLTLSNIAAAFEKTAKPRWVQALEAGEISPEGMERLKKEGPQKIREIRGLGVGRDQIADLVWHPHHGVVVRKIPLYDPRSTGSEGLKAQLQEVRKRARGWRDVKRVKGYEDLFAKPLGVRGGQTFQEYVPQKEGDPGYHINRVMGEAADKAKALQKDVAAFDKRRLASQKEKIGLRFGGMLGHLSEEDRQRIERLKDPKRLRRVLAEKSKLEARANVIRGLEAKLMEEHPKTIAGIQAPAKLPFRQRLKILQLRRRHPHLWDIRDVNMAQGKVFDLNFEPVEFKHFLPRFMPNPPKESDVKRHFFEERYAGRKALGGAPRSANPPLAQHRVPNVEVKQDWLTPGRALAGAGIGVAGLSGAALMAHLLMRKKRKKRA